MRKVKWVRFLALVMVGSLALSACGDDDGDETTAPGTGDQTGDEGAAGDDQEPVSGGEATLLFWAESPSLDPIRSNPSSGSTGLRDFALYGALVAQHPETLEMEPILAESLESNATFDVWTLTLRPDLTFSDDSPFTAEDVATNWNRIKDPANRSPAYAFASTIASMTTVDDVTLEITLTAPNAVFDRMVGRSGLNYIASGDAITSGHDLAAEPIGAGPFVLENYLRDDRMEMARNPNWYDAPRPYLDRLTLRVIPDEDQRLDTLITGDGDAVYTIAANTIARAADEGLTFEGIPVGTGTTLNFNVTKAPFDDADLRRAIAQGIDFQALVEAAEGTEAVAAANFTVEGAPWFTEDAAMPEYDVTAAQEGIDAYLQKTGQSEITIRMVSGQSPRNVAIGKFVQTSLQQLEGVTVNTEPGDQPTLLQKVFGKEYEIAVWGYPTLSPDPDLFQGVFSTSSANATGYKSTEVDGLFTEARTLGDADERNERYADIFATLAEDMPFMPLLHGEYGWVVADKFHLGGMYLDGILRMDLSWVEP